MNDKRFGIWLVGAWGGISTTVAVGLAGLQKKLVDQTGLVTALPCFSELQLAEHKWRTAGDAQAAHREIRGYECILTTSSELGLIW